MASSERDCSDTGVKSGRRRRRAFSEALLPSSSTRGAASVWEPMQDASSESQRETPHAPSHELAAERRFHGIDANPPHGLLECFYWPAAVLRDYFEAECWRSARGRLPRPVEEPATKTLQAAEAVVPPLFAARCVWTAVLSFCDYLEVASAMLCCRELAIGSQDTRGRLLTGSASLTGSRAVENLVRISPQLLVSLSLPSLSSGSEEVLLSLAQMRQELTSLKEVFVHIAPPRLPRVTGETRAARGEALSVLAGALSAALPCWLDSFQANLRGGCLLADDGVLDDLVAAVPKHLTRLGLDLNHISSQDAKAVARILPSSLRELRLLFHGRSFAWLGSGAEATGTEELASALPAGLEKLHLMLESSAHGAAMLCKALPSSLKNLALDLQMTLARGSELPEALASLPCQLSVLQLRLTDFTMSLADLRSLSNSLPPSLIDLRLDLCCRDVGDEGARLLADRLPPGLECLVLCLRDWRFSALGVRLLASALPSRLRHLKLAISSSPINAGGARALVSHLPTKLGRLNILLRHCSLGRDGEQALRPLARRWNSVPQSWVRVYEKTMVSMGLRHCGEWDLWD
ncbi:unnamed protein product [Effrenium voratum]|uniref:Uncharacterized protein n=1 Tax=Effrenium voratum TaxID=2562239 RepID=A0AA36JJD6_9DINO|nr:unnamed protein product [Effrenium voratum]CAJ1451840.1 unnamed protein product [Effrenium voratum]